MRFCFRYRTLSGLLLALCSPLWTAASNRQPHANEIVIGQSADLSGPLASISAQFLAGANAYFGQVNAQGGVHGRSIRLITLNDNNDPDLTIANTYQLLGTHKAVTLFGYTGAQNSAAALPIVTAEKIPFFAPVTGSKIVYRSFNRQVFTIRASYLAEYNYLLSRLSQIGLRRMALFNDAAGRPNIPLMQTMLSTAKAEMVASENCMENDLETIADNFIKSKPDIILIMSASREINSALIRTLRRKGYLGYFYCASLVCSPGLTADLKKLGNGLIISQIVPFPWKSDSPIVHEYQKTLTTNGINTFSYLSMEGFIAAKVLVEGLRRAGVNLSREKLIVALESMNEKSFPTPGYDINFSSSNHHGSAYIDMTTVNKEGKILR